MEIKGKEQGHNSKTIGNTIGNDMETIGKEITT